MGIHTHARRHAAKKCCLIAMSVIGAAAVLSSRANAGFHDFASENSAFLHLDSKGYSHPSALNPALKLDASLDQVDHAGNPLQIATDAPPGGDAQAVNFANPSAEVVNATVASKQPVQPLLIPLPSAVSVGGYGLAGLALFGAAARRLGWRLLY